MLLVVGLGMVLAGPAAAQFSLEPDWARRPDENALSDRYPKLPLQLEVEGRVLLGCDVTATGALTSCVVQKEQPEGFGFGEAAKRMASSFDMRPGIAVSRATPHGTVRFPINFVLPTLPPAPAARQLSPNAKALAARLSAAVDPLKSSIENMSKIAADVESVPTPGTTPMARAEAAKALREATDVRAAAGRREIAEAVAARMREADLAAAVAFIETPLGKRWFGEDAVLQQKLRQAWNERGVRYRADARTAFCRTRDCDFREDEGLRSTLVRTGPGESAAVDPDAPLAWAPWERQPDLMARVRAWPLGYMFGIDGYARATCVINARGAPDECELAYETPGGMGVGEALMRQTEAYRTTAEFLEKGVGRKVFLQAVFPGMRRNATVDPPSATSPERQALAARLTGLQETEVGRLEDDPDFARALEPLKVLDERTRAAAEAALREASEKGRGDFRAVRARLIAKAFDEESLRRLIRFEEGPGRALRRALRDAQPELAVLGQHWGSSVAREARASFCKVRDCAMPAPYVRETLSPPAK